MKFTIDRFEEKYVVVELEDGTLLDLPLNIIPEQSREGDLLQITILEEETGKRKQEIGDRFQRLLNK